MTEAERGALAALTAELRAAYEGSQRLTPAALTKARATIRAVDSGQLHATEHEQRELDTLYGLFRWGELVYPLHRIEPELFAAERRGRRMARPGPQWAD